MYRRHHDHLLHTTFLGVSPRHSSIEGDGGDGGGAGAAPGSPTTTPSIDPAALTTTLTSGLDGLGGRLEGRLAELINEVKSSRPDPAPAEPTDLDGMSRSEFAAHISTSLMGAFEAKISEMLSPLVNHVNTLSTNVSTDTVRREAEALRGRHKDFGEWNNEMVQIAKENPTLALSDLYTLARSRNVMKAAEVDKKYAVPEAPKPQRFGGLFGGQGQGQGTDAQGKPIKHVNGRESVLAAFEEVAQRHPVLQYLQNGS